MREFFQVASVCMRGNCDLQGTGENKFSELLGKCSVFSNCHEIEFGRTQLRTVGQSGVVSLGTARWFKRLEKESVELLAIAQFPPPGKFDPTMNIGIVTDGNCGLEYWSFSRKVRYRYDRDPSPITVSFTSERYDRGRFQPLTGADLTYEELTASFQSFARLCRKYEVGEPSKFEKICDALVEKSYYQSEYSDIVPTSIKGLERISVGASIGALPMMAQLNMEILEDGELSNEYEFLWKACMKLVGLASAGRAALQKKAA